MCMSQRLVSPQNVLELSLTLHLLQVYMQLEAGGKALGRVAIRLYGNAAPRTVENFVALCKGHSGLGETGKALSFSGCNFHRIIPGGYTTPPPCDVGPHACNVFTPTCTGSDISDCSITNTLGHVLLSAIHQSQCLYLHLSFICGFRGRAGVHCWPPVMLSLSIHDGSGDSWPCKCGCLT